MAEALASSSSRNFWNEIKNVNRSCSQRPSYAPVVDGICREDIANVFSSKISSLLSSANSESSDSLLHQLTDHLIFALPAIEGFVADLFTCILHHGYVPAALRDCILVPIPMSIKDPTSLDNYCLVALAPALSKALEWSILLLYPNHFTTSDLRFGFKKGMSTALCIGFI